MTDEEMAEEYYQKEVKSSLSPVSIRKAFLAGLKADRPQWHKVADGDLPKENKRYLCKIKAFVGGGISYECFDYDTEYSSWKNACGDVIAWCEIPTFDKE